MNKGKEHAKKYVTTLEERRVNKLKNVLKKLGVKEVDRLCRLFTNQETPYERRKWNRLGILDKDNKIIIDGKELTDMEVCLFDMVWKGLVRRVNK